MQEQGEVAHLGNTAAVLADDLVGADRLVLGVVGVALGDEFRPVGADGDDAVGDDDAAVHKGHHVAHLQLVNVGLLGKDQVAHLDVILGGSAHGAGQHHHGRYAQHGGRRFRVEGSLDDDDDVAHQKEPKHHAQHRADDMHRRAAFLFFCHVFTPSKIIFIWTIHIYTCPNCHSSR